MTFKTRSIRTLLALFVLLTAGFLTSETKAADLPLAAASPLTGVSFDDKPLLLPVQRNFQMAMLTAGSELGRSCGRMEAYGWRMGQTEQARVNQIFNNTVDRMRLLGYSIEPQTLTSVSKDITLFTADKSNKHFIFLWSAGELGLVLNLCETSAPIPSSRQAPTASPSVQTFNVPMDVVPEHLEAPSHLSAKQTDGFTPVGKWIGSYVCAQGYTGGTLQIDKLKGQNFEGVFKFYPTSKNESVPDGSYSVYGQYDRDSKRILINPGKWIKRPPHYYNTVIVGSFDPAHGAFSAYFQGVSGCTSFEARREDENYYLAQELNGKPGKHVVHKKKAVKKPAPKKKPAAVSQAPVTPTDLPPVISVTTPELTPAPPAPSTAAPSAPASLAAPASSVPLPAAATPSPAPAPALVPTAPAPNAATAPTAPAPDSNGILLTNPSGK